MYIESFIPTAENHTIEIPEEFYGQVIVVEIKPTAPKSLTEEERKAMLDDFIKRYSGNYGGYKFNRDEANDYD